MTFAMVLWLKVSAGKQVMNEGRNERISAEVSRP